LDFGKTDGSMSAAPEMEDIQQDIPTYDMAGLEGTVVMNALMQGTVVSIDVQEGELVRKGQQVLIMDSMKMEHVIKAETSGLIVRLAVEEGDTVYEGHPLVFIEERKELFEQMVAQAYEHGKALNTASHFELDNVIDPADSRHLITSALLAAPSPAPRTRKKRPCIDTW
jgi:pyruvate/2-oxoglutarate dehydrogenase complex dihydrolipoamide acyltransferase (E2) component